MPFNGSEMSVVTETRNETRNDLKLSKMAYNGV